MESNHNIPKEPEELEDEKKKKPKKAKTEEEIKEDKKRKKEHQETFKMVLEQMKKDSYILKKADYDSKKERYDELANQLLEKLEKLKKTQEKPGLNDNKIDAAITKLQSSKNKLMEASKSVGTIMTFYEADLRSALLKSAEKKKKKTVTESRSQEKLPPEKIVKNTVKNPLEATKIVAKHIGNEFTKSVGKKFAFYCYEKRINELMTDIEKANNTLQLDKKPVLTRTSSETTKKNSLSLFYQHSDSSNKKKLNRTFSDTRLSGKKK